MMWNIFGQTQLTYYGTTLINDAEVFNSGRTMTADTWYKFTASATKSYNFNAATMGDIVYTTDGTELTASATGTALPSNMALSEGDVIYVKSSSAQVLSISSLSLTVPSTFALNTEASEIPFSAGAMKTGTGVTAWSKNTTENITANAYFDGNTETSGNQPYTQVPVTPLHICTAHKAR